MVKRVFSLAIFSLAVVFLIGCGGDQAASNSSGNPAVVADRGASDAVDPDRNKKPRARLPIEARKNKQISTRTKSSDAVRPQDSSAAGDTVSADDMDAGSDIASSGEADTATAGKAEPVKTVAKKKSSAKKSSKRPNIGALGSASPPKIPIMAEPTGEEGIAAGDTVIEIEGKDVDGEKFALSDYAGKVVMLDFWGDW